MFKCIGHNKLLRLFLGIRDRSAHARPHARAFASAALAGSSNVVGPPNTPNKHRLCLDKVGKKENGCRQIIHSTSMNLKDEVVGGEGGGSGQNKLLDFSRNRRRACARARAFASSALDRSSNYSFLGRGRGGESQRKELASTQSPRATSG